MDLIYAYQEWPYRETFKISRGATPNSALFFAALRKDGFVGRGECSVLTQYGHTPDDIVADFEVARGLLADGLSRADLQASPLTSEVRNALDCALWDLECRRGGTNVWHEVGLARPGSLEVDLTISVDSLEKMRADSMAAFAQGYRILKLKADRSDVVAKVEAIAAAVPGAAFVVDANEAWDIDTLSVVSGRLAELGVVLIEQPLPHQDDEPLAGFRGPVPICADESCRDLADLERLSRLYQAINIKLDKVGGLTPGLELARAAKVRNLKLMVGCSGPTSLGAAPAYVVGSLADYLDLDGPALLFDDRAEAMVYERGRLKAFSPRLWGG